MLSATATSASDSRILIKSNLNTTCQYLFFFSAAPSEELLKLTIFCMLSGRQTKRVAIFRWWDVNERKRIARRNRIAFGKRVTGYNDTNEGIKRTHFKMTSKTNGRADTKYMFKLNCIQYTYFQNALQLCFLILEVYGYFHFNLYTCCYMNPIRMRYRYDILQLQLGLAQDVIRRPCRRPAE